MIQETKAAEFEHHIGYWLRFVSNTVSFAFRDRIAKLGVTVAEWVALRSLHNCAPCTLGELSEQIGIDAGATSRLIERLLRKKLVSRNAAASDRRFVTLKLTASGKALVPKLAREADRNDEAFFGQLPKADKQHLLRIMKNLVETHDLTEKPTA